jgi:hypothetical protein
VNLTGNAFFPSESPKYCTELSLALSDALHSIIRSDQSLFWHKIFVYMNCSEHFLFIPNTKVKTFLEGVQGVELFNCHILNA